MKLNLTDDINEALLSGPTSQAAKDLKIVGLCPAKRITKEGDEDEGLGRAMITTESVDRDQDVVVAAGGKLANYRLNPIVLFGHDYWTPQNIVGRSVEEKVHPGRGIEGAWKWADEENPDTAALVRRLWDGKFLNAISIGFIPTMWEKRTTEDDEELRRGWIFREWELLEYSVVTVPANQDALRLALSLMDPSAIIEQDPATWQKVQSRLEKIEKLLAAPNQPDQATSDPIISAHIGPENQDFNETMAKLNTLITEINNTYRSKRS